MEYELFSALHSSSCNSSSRSSSNAYSRSNSYCQQLHSSGLDKEEEDGDDDLPPPIVAPKPSIRFSLFPKHLSMQLDLSDEALLRSTNERGTYKRKSIAKFKANVHANRLRRSHHQTFNLATITHGTAFASHAAHDTPQAPQQNDQKQQQKQQILPSFHENDDLLGEFLNPFNNAMNNNPYSRYLQSNDTHYSGDFEESACCVAAMDVENRLNAQDDLQRISSHNINNNTNNNNNNNTTNNSESTEGEENSIPCLLLQHPYQQESTADNSIDEAVALHCANSANELSSQQVLSRKKKINTASILSNIVVELSKNSFTHH